MMRPTVVIITGYLIVLLAGCQEPVVQVKSPTEKPNVILIITDDQGYGDIGAHGNSVLNTPHLDSLHGRSIRLTDFHVNPTCSPSRAALMTGRNANRTGAWHTIAGRSQLRANEVTMADIFNSNNYQTAIFGKWHLGDNYPFRPQDRGFGEVLVHGGGGVGQQPDFWGNDYFNDTYWHNGEPKTFSGYCTDVWFDEAISFIDQRDKDQPFFCYISTNAPHGPFWVEDQYSAPYLPDSTVVNPWFYGMIANIDHNMGKLTRFLRERDLERNTLLIFMSDNGTAGGAQIDRETKHVTKGFNAGMRGTKNTPYEGGHRVPCFLYWPEGNLQGGKDITTLSAHVDMLPTLVDLLNLNTADLKYDGVSLQSALLGADNLESNRILITDSQREETPQKWKASSTMKGKWRLINGEELYHIAKDPGQKNDLAANHPEMVTELRSAYENWWGELEPTFADYPRTVLGAEASPQTTLYVHDMHLDEDFNATLPWHQRHIRSGDIKSKGWWSITVASTATYRFTLFRWPPNMNTNLQSEIEATTAEPGTNIPGYDRGNALSLTEVSMEIGNFAESKEIVEGSSVSFETQLEVGDYDLRAWFMDHTAQPLAVNYIKVEQLQP